MLTGASGNKMELQPQPAGDTGNGARALAQVAAQLESAVTSAGDAISGLLLPRSLRRFIWESSGWHQLGLCLLSVALFLVGTVPLEVQRRIVNDLVKGGTYRPVLTLALLYLALVLSEGLIKLVLNIYSSWVSENAVRHLRHRIAKLSAATVPGTGLAEPIDAIPPNHDTAACDICVRARIEGIETSLLLSEVEPVGGFIGISVMQPLLQGGILVSVFGYLTFIDAQMALLNLLIFAPQFLFVPLMQRAINRRAKRRISVLRAVSGGVIGSAAAPAAGVIQSGFGSEQDSRVDRVYRLNMGIYKLKFSMNFLMNLMYHLGVIGALAIGGWFVIEGQTEIGTVVAFVSGLAKINDPWGDIVDWFREMTVTRVKYVMVRDAADWIGHCRDLHSMAEAGPGEPLGPI
ncbi:MAG TPA: ABC transporter ATP-binding protein [Terriglobia bacterium]|nr:ABC transporter ATP-binding protein [Terriglobia bacterium]